MAWDEWEEIKADTAERQPTQMELNKLAPGNGGGGGFPDLASTPAEKKAAANAIEGLETDTKKHGDVAEESTTKAVKEFDGRDGDGWDTSRALKKAHKTWESQVKVLMGRLASEKHALRNTSVLFRNHDGGIAMQVRQSSGLDLL